MDQETKKLLAIMSITAAVIVILVLLFSGYDLNGFEIHSGIHLK